MRNSPTRQSASSRARAVECDGTRLSTQLLLSLAILFVFLILQGCTKVGPDFETPEAPVQENWIQTASLQTSDEDPVVKAEPADLSTWWEVFNDPALTQLVQLAYRQNLTLQSAGLRVIEARAKLGIAVGDQYPQVQEANGSYTNNWASKNAANFKDFDRQFEDLTVGIDSTWEIDFWGKFARSIESSNAALGATIADHDDFLVILTADVARFYIVVREAERRIVIARENVQVQTISLNIAEARFREGAVSELDVLQARALLAETQSTIPVLQIDRRQALNALAVLLGLPPSQLVDIMGEEAKIPTAPEEVAVGIPAELLRRRPDIRRAELSAAAQSAQIGVARSQLFPAFSLGGFVGLQTSGSVDERSNQAELKDLWNGESFTGFVGPSISWPFLNWGRLTNNVRVQDARFQGLIADYQNSVLEAYQEVEDGLVGFLRSRRESEFLTRSVEANVRAVELAILQYREGLADYTRVLDTQEDLLDRQDNLVVSQASVAQNQVLTYRGLGGGWQIRAPNEFVPQETIDTMEARTDWGDVLSKKDLDDAPTNGQEVVEANTYFRDVDW